MSNKEGTKEPQNSSGPGGGGGRAGCLLAIKRFHHNHRRCAVMPMPQVVKFDFKEGERIGSTKTMAAVKICMHRLMTDTDFTKGREDNSCS
jgi:hypothetical protein